MINRSITIMHIDGDPVLSAHLTETGVALVVRDSNDGVCMLDDANFWIDAKFRDRLPAAVDAFNAVMRGERVKEGA